MSVFASHAMQLSGYSFSITLARWLMHQKTTKSHVRLCKFLSERHGNHRRSSKAMCAKLISIMAEFMSWKRFMHNTFMASGFRKSTRGKEENFLENKIAEICKKARINVHRSHSIVRLAHHLARKKQEKWLIAFRINHQKSGIMLSSASIVQPTFQSSYQSFISWF